MKKNLVIIFIAFAGLASCTNKQNVSIEGELKTWHNITLTFDGPGTSEYDTINPFTDYYFNVEFSNNDGKLIVPGYFAADGNAGETSAREGNKWRVHFCAPADGDWNYKVVFLKGRNAAVTGKGEERFINGETGTIKVTATDKTAPDFRAKGRLKYTGGSYLIHAATGEAFLKGGTDSPENLLGYADFDGTYYGGNNIARAGEATPHKSLHRYDQHIQDWKQGDPSWKNGKGKGLVGGLNYLSSKGVNSIYFLTLNIMGDGDDVWPYTDRNERYRFDCSKLDQWEKVFSHAEQMGIMLHFVLQETENQCLLDCGKLDVQRKLYLRELVARFAHHLAITWNLGEEQHAADFSPYGQTYQDTKLTANYLSETDPYDNFIVIHTHSGMEKRHKDMSNYLGFENVQGPSIQVGDVNEAHDETRFWLKASADSLHRWVVNIDEIGPSWKGAMPDQYDPAHDTIRYKVLWGNLMGGGAGVEWYFGYKYPHSDLACEDWRSREKLWEQTKIALDFFHTYLPLKEMKSEDDLTSEKSDYCFAKEGQVYAIYLPAGKTTSLSLPDGKFNVSWFNPATGGELVKGNPGRIAGKGTVPVGNPPDNKDWVCLIKAE